MEEYISPEDLFEEKEKPLTLKSLEKHINEKLMILENKVQQLKRSVETIAKSLRRH